MAITKSRVSERSLPETRLEDREPLGDGDEFARGRHLGQHDAIGHRRGADRVKILGQQAAGGGIDPHPQLRSAVAARVPMSSATRARAAGSCASATESSRSKMSASAAVLSALACLRSLSPGTNSQERGVALPRVSLTTPVASA